MNVLVVVDRFEAIQQVLETIKDAESVQSIWVASCIALFEPFIQSKSTEFHLDKQAEMERIAIRFRDDTLVFSV